jgi:hypothetical protein
MRQDVYKDNTNVLVFSIIELQQFGFTNNLKSATIF